MVVRFTWRRKEWREAYLLSTTERGRASGPVPMAYLILGLMALGGLGDLAGALHQKRTVVAEDSLSPMLLLVCFLIALVTASLLLVRWRGRLRGLPAIPNGEQQITVHEMGWGTAASEDVQGRDQVESWSELRGLRTGRRVLALLTRDGRTVGVPLRALTADQGGWLERLLLRKVPHAA